jgi:hypothetical protein
MIYPRERDNEDKDGFKTTTIREDSMPGSYVDDWKPLSPSSSRIILYRTSAMIVRSGDRHLRSAIDDHQDPSYRQQTNHVAI